ncbi:MAG: D-aminoacyl-tRNA deacylase, partial [Pseudomonadota bacterium]|nr:D-aminoacyl-tRNA deacylase [Pseudomonadota bacterium]
MRALVQRVTEARVTVGGAVIGEIGMGAMILVCAMQGDDDSRAEALAAKIAKLRIFRDEDDRMNRSLLDCG